MARKNNYWAEREKAEKKWQLEQEKKLEIYNKHISDLYQQAIDDINKEIKVDIGFAGRKLVKADSMKEYENLAKKVVAKADTLRAKGHHVTRKDFSKDVNDRLKIYNATMRINKNEILKSKIGARLVELGVDQEENLTNKLWNDYTKEKDRQAGILGITTKDKTWSSTEVQKQIYASIANANFSNRIWADIDGLKGTLDGLVSTAIIRGDNPKEMAQWLTGMVSASVGNQRYVAERLARTETARIQTAAAKSSFKAYGYKYVKWYAEGSACKKCREIAHDDNGWGEGIYKVNDVPEIPVHPNCMCSIGAYWVDGAKIIDEEATADTSSDLVFVSEKNAEALGPTYTKRINDALNNAPKRMQKLYAKFANDPKLEFTTADTSYYTPFSTKIVFNKKFFDDSNRPEMETYFHEVGHLIDYATTPMRSKSKAYLSDLHKTMREDIQDQIDIEANKILEHGFKTEELGKWADGTVYVKSTLDHVKYTKSGKVQKRVAQNAAKTKFYDELRTTLKSEIQKNGWKDYGGLSDGIQYATKNGVHLGWGHANSYYRGKGGDNNGATEFFANVSAAEVLNSSGYKQFKKYFPKSVKQYNEIVDDILKGK